MTLMINCYINSRPIDNEIGERWRTDCIEIPVDAVSVVGVPETPAIAKNHGVLVGKRSANYNSMATHYLQKPSILKMQQAGAIFEDDDCEGGEAVYIDTGVVIFTGKAVKSFLSLLDDPTVNICTAKGINSAYNTDPGKSIGSSDTPPSALRLELYSDILHAMALCDSPNDLETYFQALGISLNSTSEGLTNSAPYVIALTSIWGTFCRTPLHLVSVPYGKFCHLGTSSELLSLLSCCTDGEASSNKISSLESAPRDCNDAINVKSDKLRIFSNKYSMSNFVKSTILHREGKTPYVTQHNLSSSRHSFSSVFKGVTINSILIPNNEKNKERTFFTNTNSLVEHSILSGDFSVGSSCVVSHLPGFLGQNLSVQNGMMVQYVPILRSTAETVEKGVRTSDNRYLLFYSREV